MLALASQPSRITVAVQGGQTGAISATGEYSFVINSNTARLIIAPGVLMPSNLRVTSGSNGSDIGFAWDAGAGAISYIIEVHDNIGLRRTWETSSLSSVYTATMAVTDGGHKRSYTIKIASLNSSVGRSDFAELLVENAAPATPAGVRVVEQFSNFIVSCQNTLEGDYAGMIVWAHTSAGVPLDDAHKVYDGYAQSAVITWPSGTPEAYFVVARYDSFGKVDLNTSSEFAGTLLPSGGIAQTDTLPGTTYLGDNVVYYSGDQSLYWWDESLDPDAYVRALPLVVADQIYSIDLKTISATIGELNLGEMNLDAAGYIRGGQSDYDTGTGFWQGYSGGAYKFSMGNSAGDKITWDGTSLSVVGSISVDYSAITGTKPPPDADKTVSLDYSAVTGTKPPADADKTVSAIQSGTTITGGGITLSGGGAIKTFGKNSASATTAGFFLGWDTSAYQFAIGNATQNMKWNGSTLSFTGGGFDVSTTGNVRGGQTGYNTGTGFFLGYSGGANKFSIGNPSGNRMTWDGTNLNIVGGGTFSGALSAATGTFAGALSAATGTFAGTLSAATGSFSGSLSGANITGATGTFSGSLSAASVTTGNIVSDAITKVNSQYAEFQHLFNNGDTIVSADSSSSTSGPPMVVIDFGLIPFGNYAHIITLYRDATLIATFPFTTTYPVVPFAFTVSDAPGDTSAHTYSLKNSSGLPRWIKNRSIVVSTHKR